MTQHTVSKFVSLGLLGLLVFFFSVILLIALVRVAALPHGPGIGGFSFAISRRALTITAGATFVVFASAVFLFARALRGRQLN